MLPDHGPDRVDADVHALPRRAPRARRGGTDDRDRHSADSGVPRLRRRPGLAELDGRGPCRRSRWLRVGGDPGRPRALRRFGLPDLALRPDRAGIDPRQRGPGAAGRCGEPALGRRRGWRPVGDGERARILCAHRIRLERPGDPADAARVRAGRGTGRHDLGRQLRRRPASDRARDARADPVAGGRQRRSAAGSHCDRAPLRSVRLALGRDAAGPRRDRSGASRGRSARTGRPVPLGHDGRGAEPGRGRGHLRRRPRRPLSRHRRRRGAGVARADRGAGDPAAARTDQLSRGGRGSGRPLGRDHARPAAARSGWPLVASRREPRQGLRPARELVVVDGPRPRGRPVGRAPRGRAVLPAAAVAELHAVPGRARDRRGARRFLAAARRLPGRHAVAGAAEWDARPVRPGQRGTGRTARSAGDGRVVEPDSRGCVRVRRPPAARLSRRTQRAATRWSSRGPLRWRESGDRRADPSRGGAPDRDGSSRQPLDRAAGGRRRTVRSRHGPVPRVPARDQRAPKPRCRTVRFRSRGPSVGRRRGGSRSTRPCAQRLRRRRRHPGRTSRSLCLRRRRVDRPAPHRSVARRAVRRPPSRADPVLGTRRRTAGRDDDRPVPRSGGLAVARRSTWNLAARPDRDAIPRVWTGRWSAGPGLQPVPARAWPRRHDLRGLGPWRGRLRSGAARRRGRAAAPGARTGAVRPRRPGGRVGAR